jgi:hypothetical protein
MPTKLQGIIRTVTAGRALVWMPRHAQDFAVDPGAIADVMKALLAQARVFLLVEGDVIVGVELEPGGP